MSAPKVKREALKPENNNTPRDDDICELEHLRKLFIGGLAPYTTEENLKNFYGQWGKVVDVVVMRDPVSKRSRGFGFITYTKSAMVDKAQDNRPHIIDGKTVEAKRALPRPERESRETNISVKKLFVGGLKDNHDEECLQEYFSQFGHVISIKILTDKTTGKRRGFAFIEFDDYDAVDKAVLQKAHSIKFVVVDVKKSIYNQDQHRLNLKNGVNPLQGSKGNKNMQQSVPPGYGPPPPSNMAPYHQPPPPPQNYNNYWGPPPSNIPPQQYGGYQQPPGPPMNNWNYSQPWNSGPPPPGAPQQGPPQPGPPPNWHQNQWRGPPPPGPTGPVAPPAPPNAAPPLPQNWNSQPIPNAPVPPPAPNNGPPPPQQVPPPNNFGAGYQQNYGGGPSKVNMNSNRMNPYNNPNNKNYGNNGPSASNTGYGNYNAQPIRDQVVGIPNANGPGPVPKPMTNGAQSASAGNKYRR